MLWQPSLPDRYTLADPAELGSQIEARKRELGSSTIVLGHHYQADEVIRHADLTGDSLKLSRLAAEIAREREIEHVIFCGVHFMAETADMVTPDHVQVILPDLSAGCSMADMADHEDAVDAWETMHERLAARGWDGRIVPVTYVNSSAAVKAFVGANGGACCTSSNAGEVFEWAMAGGTEPRGSRDIKILFLPDQHLGRNTAAAAGIDVARHAPLYDPRLSRRGEVLGGMTEDELVESQVILWAGHCSVHKLFRPEHCDEIREQSPGMQILVHPECCKEVVDRSDLSGSTEFIIRTIEDAAPGSQWAVGTEVHLVSRLARSAAARGVEVRILSECQCLCTTMFRIDQAHLLWVLDHLAGISGERRVKNRIEVSEQVREPALLAIERMLCHGFAQPSGEAKP